MSAQTASAVRAPDGVMLCYLKDYTAALQRFRKFGGRRKQAFDKAASIQVALKMDGIEALKGLKVTKHGETRLKGAVKYDLGLPDAYRLITIQRDKVVWFCFVGTHDECDDWLERHRGLKPTLRDGEIVIVDATEPGDAPIVKAAPQPSDAPLLHRLPEAFRDDLLNMVPGAVAVRVSAMPGASDHADAQGVGRQIADQTLSAAVQDVLCRLIEGDREGAEGRIDLHLGRARAEEEWTDDDLITLRDGDRVRAMRIGSIEHGKWLDDCARAGGALEWLLFMHPEQRKVAEEGFAGPAQLSGVSGAGKTCVAVHRAVRLARARSDAQVLLVTLNRSLAGLIARLIEHAEPDADVRARLRVTSFFELCQNQLRDFEPKRTRHYDDVAWKNGDHVDEVFREYYRCWTNNHDASVLLDLHRNLTALGIDAETYVREEFDWIRSALPSEARSDYLTIAREGRRHPILQNARAAILRGLGGWEAKMEVVGVIDYLGLTTAVTRHLGQIEPTFDHVLIDEAQDFGTTELSVLRRLARPGPDDVFLCGDLAQHVLPKHRRLRHAGIDTGSRARRIVRNYRNTRQILEAAYHVLMDNLDDEIFAGDRGDLEILDPRYANRESNAPLVLEANSLAEELAFARTMVDAHLLIAPDARCCIAIAGHSMRDVAQYAQEVGLRALDGSSNAFDEALVLSDLEQTKGYEFDLMVIANCADGVLPPVDAAPEEVHRHGARLYVAMTRAKTDLYLSFSGRPSRWLETARAKLNFERWDEVEVLNRAHLRPAPDQLPQIETAEAELGALTGRQFLYCSEALGLSAEAQDKLAVLVDGRGARAAGGRRIRWRAVAEALDDLAVSPDVRRAFGPEVSRELLGMAAKLPTALRPGA
ncbi:MAG: superfamily I DNA/RNA helicase [Paracoccaceae bacterium]|jgi:superfamily I DNA/RNA helicase